MQGNYICPSCGAGGKAVSMLTVQSLAMAKEQLPATDPGYRFCKTHGCPVVYYPTETPDAAILRVEDVSVRVGQKRPGSPTPVCYCFSFTAEDIQEQLSASGQTTIPAQIRSAIHAGRCACETTNPQGSCCLGNVQAEISRIQKSDGGVI